MEKEINQLLKDKRLQLKLTLEEIASMVGVNKATVARWESGDIANMRRDKIVLLAKALQISPAVIMGWNLDSEHAKQLSKSEQKLVDTCQGADDEQMKQIIKYAEFILSPSAEKE